MPFGTVKNPKNSRLYVRFQIEEKRDLSGEAKNAGLTMSEYVRRRALGLAVKSRVSEQAINELLEGKKLPEQLRGRVVRFAEIADDALAYCKANNQRTAVRWLPYRAPQR